MARDSGSPVRSSTQALALLACFVAGCVATAQAVDIRSLASKLTISPESLVHQVQRLGHINPNEDPYNVGVTRLIFDEYDVKARRYIKDLMLSAGLEVREDAMGNIYGRLQGTEPDAAPVVSGSHCDAIPLSGMYDGTIGVLGAIAALDALNRAGFRPKRPIDAMMFTSEEPTRFGISCIGSRALADQLPVTSLTAVYDANNLTFMEAAKGAGYGGESAEAVIANVQKGSKIAFFVELHIEQGPILEAEADDIGIVTAIAAPAAVEVEFVGDGGHAGGQLMHFRNDASLAAAELALQIEDFVLSTKTEDTVGTAGRWTVQPNAVNSVPRYVKLEIDIRDIDQARRDAVIKDIFSAAESIGQKRKVQVYTKVLTQDPPAQCSSVVHSSIEQACTALSGLSRRHMVSRAYHDSLFMAQIAPTGMIFIPCYRGFSHRPDEFAAPEALERGVRVLALALAQLAGMENGGSDMHDASEL